jgi:hypothetical protein
MKLFLKTHVQSDDRQKKMQQFVDSQAQLFVTCWFSIIVFFSISLNLMNLFFLFNTHITVG